MAGCLLLAPPDAGMPVEQSPGMGSAEGEWGRGNYLHDQTIMVLRALNEELIIVRNSFTAEDLCPPVSLHLSLCLFLSPSLWRSLSLSLCLFHPLSILEGLSTSLPLSFCSVCFFVSCIFLMGRKKHIITRHAGTEAGGVMNTLSSRF